MESILSVKNLNVKFRLRGRVLHAIRDVSLDLFPGESLAIVGESGSGKTVLTKTFIGLLDANGWVDSGEILYGGHNLAEFKTEPQWRTIRGREIAMVMQDPMTSLNPLKTIGAQIIEAILLHQHVSHEEAHRQMIEALSAVGIAEPERRSRQYPHEFSGGMRQRVVIAIAVACRPKILICDEPTTALDVTIQAQILELIKILRQKLHLTCVYITHDFGVVANVADRIAVMYAGDIVEIGSCEEIFYDPRHPYTWALLSSLPQLGRRGEPLYTIQGAPPNLFQEIRGDAFAPRNPHALKIDFEERPPYFDVSETHKARTWLLDPRAPKLDPPERLHALRRIQLGRAIIRIHPTYEGEILYDGQKINGHIDKALDKAITRKIQMIFQDPMASLNERAKVDYIVSEGIYSDPISKEKRREMVEEALMDVGLLPEFASRFPHEFSGGQRQRIGIARALIMQPEFIIADEPISALDVSIRAQVLNLLGELQKKRALTYLFISHDLSVMRFICDRIAVIHLGHLVELAETEKLFRHPLHPYTRALLSAVPQPDPISEKHKVLTVYDPSMHDYSVDKPVWTEIEPGHFVLGNQKELEEYRGKLGE